MKLPELPDAAGVPRAVAEWSAADAKFAGILASANSPEAALARWCLELLAADRVAEGISAIRAALALDPEEPVLWSNYGAALNQGGFTEEATACLGHSLKILPGQPDAWLLLGMLRKKTGDLSGAEEAYRQALALEPQSISAWQLLGLLKEEQKDYASAISCLRACMEAGGGTAPLLAYAGKLSYNLGRFAEARDAYVQAGVLDAHNAHYHRLARRCSFICSMMDGKEVDAAVAEFHRSHESWGGDSQLELAETIKTAFSELSGFGHREAAEKLGLKLVGMWPEDASMKYLLGAVAGNSALDRSPPDYLAAHFDSFAEGFEAQLVGELGYDIPAKICQAAGRFAVAGHLHETLDAGCGTGLCAAFLRPMSRHLAGVDISPKMLAQAEKKGVYDELVCADLAEYLKHAGGRFDLMVAADVMIYFGDARPLVSGAAMALRNGGLLAFSTESFRGEGFQLRPSGRFAHAPGYIKAVAAEKFELLEMMETTVRLEANDRLPGNIFIFRKL